MQESVKKTTTMETILADSEGNRQTGYTLHGKEIVLKQNSGRPHNYGKGILPLPAPKQLEVAGFFAVTGSFEKTAELAKTTPAQVRKWRKEPWFQELLDEVREENDDRVDAKFTEALDIALDLIKDRMVNGDFHVLRDGSQIRKPVNLKDLTISEAIIVDKRQILRKKPTSITETQTSSEHVLEKLANTFIELAQNKKKTKEVIEDVEFTTTIEQDSGEGQGNSLSLEEVSQDNLPEG